ncbi:MAG: hypothetical protein J6I31_06420 [Prevotella sp.]|nr:hypothetical protein [Prevotella sp.]
MDKKKQDTQVAMMTPKKVRGTATIYAGGDIEFRAQGEGQPQKKVIKRQGNSQFYETQGTRPKLCAHLMCDADDPVAASTLQQQLDGFLDGFGSKAKPVRPRKKDRMLWDKESLRVWYRADSARVEISLSLPVATEGQTIEQNALKQFQSLYQCFTINKQFLLDAARAQKKTGNG